MKMTATTKSSQDYLAQVWTGDRWLTLGVYRTKAAADKRIEKSKSHQDHRACACTESEAAQARANISLRTRDEKKRISDRY
jgi:hypothetical protein